MMMGKFIGKIFHYFCQLFDYRIKFVMTGCRSDDSGVLNATLYDRVCDDWRQVRGVLYATLCDRVCGDWRQVRGVFDTTLCDRVCGDWGKVRCYQYNLM
jgi:hypothetical protein